MLINYFFTVVFSCFAGIVFVSLLRKLAIKEKFLIPKGIPLIGGIAIGMAFILVSLLCFFIQGSLTKEIRGIIIASFIILVFGAIDDLWELSIMAKFLVQLIATSVLILFGIVTHIIYIGTPLNIVITFFWVLGIANAFNHLDVMDGLAAGTAIIVDFAFFAVSFINGDIRIVILSLALAGAIFGFFLYNLPPAKAYMGNSGSHFLGFVLAAIAIVISYAPLERKIALFSPILILGFPIFDTLFLMLIRINKKKLPFKKSNDHLALRFLVLGYSKKKALAVMLTWCLFFCFCGILVSQTSNLLGITIITIVILISLALTKKMSQVTIDD